MRSESNNIKLSQLVGKYFVKYSRLSDLINYAYAGSEAVKVNVFIDLYSIKNTVLGKNFVCDSDNELTALVLDMCVHYKKFFYGIGVFPAFYLVDSNNLPVHSKSIYPAYNTSYAVKLTSGNSTLVNYNMELLGSMCPYIPNVYYVPTSFEASVVIHEIASSCTFPSIVIGRDDYLSMLPGLVKDLAWIRPSKYKGNDVSAVYVARNVYTFVQQMVQSKNSAYTPCRLGPSQLDKVYALTKFPARDMPPCLQYRTLVRILDENPVLCSASPGEIYGHGPSICHPDQVNYRYQVLSIPAQSSIFRMSPESATLAKHVVDFYDTEGLKHINNKYFEKNPLDLDELLR